MARNYKLAYGFFGMDAVNIKHMLGVSDTAISVLYLLPNTRRIAFVYTMLSLGSAIYAQHVAGMPYGVLVALMGAAGVGFVCVS